MSSAYLVYSSRLQWYIVLGVIAHGPDRIFVCVWWLRDICIAIALRAYTLSI